MTEDTMWLNVDEAAEYLRIKPSWIRNNWKRQCMPFKKFGGQMRIEQDELQNWARSQQT